MGPRANVFPTAEPAATNNGIHPAMRPNEADMASELGAGDAAPDFELPTDSGGRTHLMDLKGKAVVIYFYPKDDTSGCTAEAIAFNGLRAKFAAAGAAVIGVSPDSAASHDKFKRKHDLKIALAADPDRSAIEAYGVWKEKSCTGESISGSSARPSSSTAMAASPRSGAR
jgi:peroxiredoxin Q/BCP